MPDQPVKVATIECATCNALIEVFTLSGMPGLGWVVADPLRPVPPTTANPLHACSQRGEASISPKLTFSIYEDPEYCGPAHRRQKCAEGPARPRQAIAENPEITSGERIGRRSSPPATPIAERKATEQARKEREAAGLRWPRGGGGGCARIGAPGGAGGGGGTRSGASCKRGRRKSQEGCLAATTEAEREAARGPPSSAQSQEAEALTTLKDCPGARASKTLSRALTLRLFITPHEGVHRMRPRNRRQRNRRALLSFAIHREYSATPSAQADQLHVLRRVHSLRRGAMHDGAHTPVARAAYRQRLVMVAGESASSPLPGKQRGRVTRLLG